MKPASEKRTRAWTETRISDFQLANSGRGDALARHPAVRFSQVADAGTALGGGNAHPIAPRRSIGQTKTGFQTEAGLEAVVTLRKPRQERAQLTNLGLMYPLESRFIH